MFTKKNKHYVSCLFILGIVGTYIWMTSCNGCGIRSKAEDNENYINYVATRKRKDISARP